MASVKELKAEAKKAGVTGYGKMNKTKLLIALGMATVKDLRAAAKVAKIAGYGKMKKADLEVALMGPAPAKKKAATKKKAPPKKKAKPKKVKRTAIKMKDLLELVIITDKGERLMLQQAPPRFIGMYQLYPERD